jgi:Icc-related predicted phosphoesterase
MKILSISDIHGRLGPLELLTPRLEASDIVILAGDITNFGHADDARDIIQTLQASASLVLAVSGNCDYPDVAQSLDEMGISLEGRAITVEEVSLIGLGGSLSGPVPTPNVFSEPELAASLTEAVEGLAPDAPLILVSHQPPKDTAADRTSGGHHVGSTAVREFIQAYQPLVCFTAHIHESRGVSHIGETLVINPGPLSAGSVGFAHVDGGQLVTCEIQALG